MEPRGLPRPATTSELYLAAILDELRQLRHTLEPPQPSGADEGTVELKEPEAASAKTRSRKRG